jgi:hypothetical protein
MCEISWHTYEMHSAFYEKSGVTEWYQSNADYRTQPQIEIVEIKDSLFLESLFDIQNILFTLKKIFYSLFFNKIISFVFFYTESDSCSSTLNYHPCFIG